MPLSADQTRALRDSRPLGKGGMGEVYRTNKKLGREVAVKVQSNVPACDPEHRTRFEPEAKLPGIAELSQQREHLWLGSIARR